MNQHQSGLNATCRGEHCIPPPKLLHRAMKAESHKLCVPNLLSAKVCLAHLTPSQLPSNALEQYYRLSVKSRVNSDWSEWNGVRQSNVLPLKQPKDIGRRIHDEQCHRRKSYVDSQTSPRAANHPLKEKMSSSPVHTNKRPVADLASTASKAGKSHCNTLCKGTARVCIKPLSPELAVKTLKTLKQPCKPSAPVQRPTKIYQATGPSTSFQQAVGMSASTTCNLADKPLSTTPPLARQPVQIGKAFLNMPSLNVCLSPISPGVQKVNQAISPSSSPDQLRTSVCKSSGSRVATSATSARRFEQPFSPTHLGKLHSVVPVKTECLADKPGLCERKGFSSVKWPIGGKVCSSVASVCLSPLRPDQLPSNARKQFEKQSVKNKPSKCATFKRKRTASAEVKHKALQRKGNGNNFVVDKRKLPTLKQVKKTSNKHDASRKHKAPLQTRKDNLQSLGVPRQKDRLTKTGRVIPSYIEVVTETDSSDSDEEENKPLAYLIGKKNKMINRTKSTKKFVANNSTKGMKRKAELGDQATKKSKKNLCGLSVNCERKPKCRTVSRRKYRIPARYCNIKFSQVSDITRIKTRYRVAFALWPHVFGGALDVINQRLARQNAIWNGL